MGTHFAAVSLMRLFYNVGTVEKFSLEVGSKGYQKSQASTSVSSICPRLQ